jgi:hypothetical protein
MSESNTSSHPYLHPEFSSTYRKIFDEQTQKISSNKDKLDQLVSIRSFAVLLIPAGARRPPAESGAILKGLGVLWYMFIQTAQIIDFDDTLQDRLVTLLLWTKEFDLHCRTLYPPTEPALPNWESCGFVENLQTAWKQLLASGTPSQLRNLAAFSAKSLAVGICPDTLGLTSLSYLCEALETDDETTIATRLPAVTVWIEQCRDKLLVFSVTGRFSEAKPEVAHLAELGVLARRADVKLPGCSLERWLFWRRRLQQLSHHSDPAVAKEARKGFMSMVTCGRLLDYEVPGEAKFEERVQVAMTEALATGGNACLNLEEADFDVDWVD